ncbi:MAG: hypothetical protein HWN66_06195 [Candidatus Helarchaeota archaeon]|nr:hypothetical protein [Candidatus Helarchaeota archaeon]
MVENNMKKTCMVLAVIYIIMIVWLSFFFTTDYARETWGDMSWMGIGLLYLWMGLGIPVMIFLSYIMTPSKFWFIFLTVINLMFWISIIVLNSLPILKVLTLDQVYIAISVLILFGHMLIPPLIKQLYNIEYFGKAKLILPLIYAVQAVTSLLFTIFVPLG